MKTRSPFYWNAQTYKLGLKLIHGKNFDRRYQYIADEIGANKSILEPACGPAILADYIHKGCTYKGYDLNESFVKYSQKKGLRVYIGDALNPAFVEPSDVAVIIDSLHHVGSGNEQELLENVLSIAKEKIIICNPFNDNYLKLLPNWFPGGQKLLQKYFDYIENDGTNKVLLKDTKSQAQLIDEMLNGFDVLPKNNIKLHTLGEDIIATYFI